LVLLTADQLEHQTETFLELALDRRELDQRSLSLASVAERHPLGHRLCYQLVLRVPIDPSDQLRAVTALLSGLIVDLQCSCEFL